METELDQEVEDVVLQEVSLFSLLILNERLNQLSLFQGGGGGRGGPRGGRGGPRGGGGGGGGRGGPRR